MLKQALVIRTDLQMGKGKLAAQAAHASIDSFQEALYKDPDSAQQWLEEGMPKIVLKVQTDKELIDLFKHAKSLKLPCSLIHDAGHTQIAAGSVTALGIGPAEEQKINQVTGKLKLL
ncbi:aminoacyl-tRNA hydrolase [Candidatus Micrarchaeota archaeon]|nr:aminoacyl-tRNA hydrolase [Candidatus Micrarchaeota archaeon]